MLNLTEEINRQLTYLYSNGKGEAGLEVGADVGLRSSEYIRIPRCMKKQWIGRIALEHQAKYVKKGSIIPVFNEGDDVSSFVSSPGWVSEGILRIRKGIHEARIPIDGGHEWVPLDEFHIVPHTADDMRKFYTVNQDHINEDDLDSDHHFWVHAVRMWAVMGGLVVTSKNHEFVLVEDPDEINQNSDDFINYAMKFMVNAWTAAAARTTSWKKTSHATGGTPAIGLPRRWMAKEGFWKTFNDKNAQTKANNNATSAFYIATHAISVHAVLSQFAPDDEHHYCHLYPAYGMIWKWDIGESIKIRMNPRDQVSGVSMVTDSMVVLKMLVSEGLAPILENIGQAQSLKNAHEIVKSKGMACAMYKKWYFDEYPDIDPSLDFNQRDPSFFDLISELSIIAVKYYSSSTIAQSPTLQNVASQSNFESLKSAWAMASILRQDIVNSDLSKVVNVIRGATSVPVITSILSDDVDVSNEGRKVYNLKLSFLSTLVGIDKPKVLEMLGDT